jgi:small subunit ribosomal protein S1
VHISELAERHVELPEQVVTVGSEIFVRVIDIDLERRRISLSLKQANDESVQVAEFDPTLYGMAAEYDEQGNYKYPEGFDPETNEWLPGFETQREKWEKQYAEAHARWEAHKAQVEQAAKDDAEAASAPESSASYSSGSTGTSSTGGTGTPAEAAAPAAEAEGTLASDEALAALREKLTGN